MNEEEKKQVLEILMQLKDETARTITAVLDILEGFKPATERPPAPQKKAEGTSFADIDLEYEQFDIKQITIAKIFPEKSGPTKDGNQWQKQSIIITDHTGTERELIAWGSDIDKFRNLRVGDLLNIECIKKVSEYTHSRTGKVSIQYTISGNTDISIVKDKEQHQL